MGPRIAKYFLIVPMLIILAFFRASDVIGGCLLVILAVSFGLLWERYSSSFSVLAPRREDHGREGEGFFFLFCCLHYLPFIQSSMETVTKDN